MKIFYQKLLFRQSPKRKQNFFSVGQKFTEIHFQKFLQFNNTKFPEFEAGFFMKGVVFITNATVYIHTCSNEHVEYRHTVERQQL